MESLLPVVFFLGITALAVGILIWSVLREKRRTETFEALAAEMGFDFAETDNDFGGQFPGFKLFQQGHGRQARRVMRGDAGGITVCIADYRYVTGSGKNRSVHNLTALLLTRTGMGAPHCALRTQHFYDLLGKLVGFQDIDFDEDPEFSKAYVLQGEDEAAVRERFGPEVRAHFLELRRKNVDLQFEAAGDTLLLYVRRLLSPEEIQAYLEHGFAILQLWA